MLKVVIVGYGEMAASLMLGTIESRHKLVGVFRDERTLYDSNKLWLKDTFNPSSLYSLMKLHNVPDVIAQSVNSDEYRNEILRLNPDIVLVGSWGEIFQKESILLPPMGTINCHPSLLPAYRGANPYYAVIRNGEKQTGLTLHLMDESLDTGPILLQKEIDIFYDDTGGSLKRRTCAVMRESIGQFLDDLATGSIIPQPQKEEQASYYKKINASEIIINFSDSADEIYRQVRAMNPWNACYIPHGRNYLRTTNVQLVDSDEIIIKNHSYELPNTYETGQVLQKGENWLVVGVKDGKKLLFNDIKLFAPGFSFMTPLYMKFFVKINQIFR